MQPQYSSLEEAQCTLSMLETEPDSSCEPAPRPLTESERQKAIGLLKSLKRRDPVRASVEALLRGEQPSFEVIRVLYQTPDGNFGFRWRQAELAAWTLGHVPLTSTQRRFAAERLERIVPLSDWPNGDVRLVHGLLRTLVVGIALSMVGLGGDLMSFLPLCIPLPLLVFPISGIIEDIRLNRVRAAAAESLGLLGEPTSAGILAEAVLQTTGFTHAFGINPEQTVGCRAISRAATHALPAVLANLTPEHYGQLPARSVPRLCTLLLIAQKPLALMILEALGKVGDGSTVASVQRMAARDRTPDLREAAERILPILEQRQQQENAPKVLLRAAAAPQAPADILLRPAAGTSEADPQQLLRASDMHKN